MIEELWTGILELTAQLVIPDWASLIALIPIAVLVAVLAWLGWTVRRLATAGPTRRGKTRISPIPPAGVHAGAPSYAPIFGAIGTFLLLWGLVVGGIAVLLGVVALVIGLLYWGREALAEYEHVEPALDSLPAVVHQPPPGVHVPGPSFRPLLGALGTAGLLFGLVFSGWVLAVAVAFFVVTLLGWLRDARGEYVKTLEADATGHLDSLPAPGYPSRLLIGFTLVALLALSVDAGLLPPRSADAGGGEPGPSGEPSGPPASGEPSPAPSEPTGDVVVHAKGVAFVEKTITIPSDKAFTIAFINEDATIDHNVEIRDSGGATSFRGEIFKGVDSRVYDVPAIATGSGFTFHCTVHPNMVGDVTFGAPGS